MILNVKTIKNIILLYEANGEFKSFIIVLAVKEFSILPLRYTEYCISIKNKILDQQIQRRMPQLEPKMKMKKIVLFV